MNEYLNLINKIQFFLGTDISNKTVLSLLIIIVFLVFIQKIKSNFIFITLFTLPGTFMHELMHYIVSLITNGKPISLTVIPKKQDIKDEYGRKIGYNAILGSVSSKNIKWYNSFLISLAPLLLYIIVFYMLNFVNNLKNDYMYFIFIYIMATFIYAGFPSITDWKLAFKYSKWFFYILILIFIIILINYTNISKIDIFDFMGYFSNFDKSNLNFFSC